MTAIQRARRALRDRDEAELCRLLYVAITRARSKVFVVGGPKKAGTQSMLALLHKTRGHDEASFDALLPTVTVDSINDTRRFTTTAPERHEEIGIMDDVLTEGVPRVRASTLFSLAEPQQLLMLGGVAPEIHDDDVVPPRARGRLAHAIIALIVTTAPDVIDDDAHTAAMVGAAERAIGAPPGAIDDALRARLVTTLTGPVRALRQAGCRFEAEVPAVFVSDQVVVESTADLLAINRKDTTVIELKLSTAAARGEAALVQALACCAALEQRGHSSLRASVWAIGERTPPPSVPWGKAQQRHLASVLARIVSIPATG